MIIPAVRNYPWGSHTAIARMRGLPYPTADPEAELWLGTHPVAPSHVIREGRPLPLSDVLGGRLPFLLKVIAVGAPLSVQVHPSDKQARESDYADTRGKPEMIVAVTPFEALCGVRDPREAAQLIEQLRLPALAPLTQVLPDQPEVAWHRLLAWPSEDRAALVRSIAASTRDRWVRQLAARYPTDPMVLSPLLLQHRALHPGEALLVAPGTLHCYLDGLGVEIMAASDNVVRAGLTDKAVDVPALMRIADFQSAAPPVVPTSAQAQRYPTLCNAFRLDRIPLDGEPYSLASAGPQLLLCTDGEVSIGATPLTPGSCAYACLDDGPLNLGGRGTIFRATTPG